MKDTSPNFEKLTQRLQEIVKKLEGGELALEDSLKLFEEGVSLTRQCQEHLQVAEQKVEQLLKISPEGQIETKKF